jgi:hypothetical protein
LHPVALSALVLLVVNDHLLKGSAVPGIVTGKLSDVAGIVLLPLVLQATWECSGRVLGHPVRSRARWMPIAITAIAFTAIQVSGAAAGLYERTLGLLQWLPAAGWAVLAGRPAPAVLAASCVPDLTDLLVLPVCLIPAWLLRDRARGARLTPFGASTDDARDPRRPRPTGSDGARA